MLRRDYQTDQIRLVNIRTYQGTRVELYRNLAYTCGVRGYQTFVIASPVNIPEDEAHPLWVRMHGGGVGAFDSDGMYLPNWFYPDSLDEETSRQLARPLQETGLVAKIQDHPARFRFLLPSMCDHDLFSGIGLPEPNNPHFPDENGRLRSADGLLATKAALAFTLSRYKTTHVFLHGTSAGAAGAFSVTHSFEIQGLKLSGIIMDSGIIDDRWIEIIQRVARQNLAACVDYLPMEDAKLLTEKIGPIFAPDSLPKNLVSSGEMSVPIFLVWNRGDPTFCGEAPIVYTGADGTMQVMNAVDYLMDGLRQAIQVQSSGGRSQSLRMCVSSGPQYCSVHAPTKTAYNQFQPAGDQDHLGMDYNQYILDWVNERLKDPPPDFQDIGE